MHLRYCPTVTSPFTIKIRFCFLLPVFFFFPQLSLHGLSAQLGKLCACRSGPPRGSWVSAEQAQVWNIWNVFVSLTSDRSVVHSLSSVGCSCSLETVVALQDDKRRVPTALLWAAMVEEGTLTVAGSYKRSQTSSTDSWSKLLFMHCSSILINSNWWTTCYSIGLHPFTLCHFL